MLRQALILKVFEGASRSRRDCGNREADKAVMRLQHLTSAAVAATAAIVRRQRSGHDEVVEICAAVAATAAIVRRASELRMRSDAEPQSPRLRQS